MTGNWRADLKFGLETLVDNAVVQGADRVQVFEALMNEMENLRQACDRDPDPADDMSAETVEEPANDWPGAEN